MKPYYEEAGITIYHGDCREILPTLGRFDLCLTDPPYGINIAANPFRQMHKRSDWDAAAPDADERVVAEVARVLEQWRAEVGE